MPQTMRQQKGESKTILQVVPGLHTGGAERTALDISAAIIARGWRSIIASAGGRMVTELEAQGATHITLPLEAKNPLTILANGKALAKIIAEEDVDLIHARSRGPGWSCLRAARKTSIPFVTTYHGAYSQSNAVKAWYNSVMARADTVIANSNWTKDLITSRNPWAKDRIVTIYRGTDFAAFSPNAIEPQRLANLRKQWSVEEGDFTVVHLARLTGWKGQQVVIASAAKLRDNHPNLRFILAGDHQGRDDYLAGLNSSIEAHGLQEVVKLPGHCDDPAAAMALADAVVVASTDAEAFGRAAVEASAFEKPLVVTDIGAVVETVLSPPDVPESQRTGWKVIPNDAADMAKAFDELLALPQGERDAIGQNARAHVVANFSLERMCRETIDVYEKLV